MDKPCMDGWNALTEAFLRRYPGQTSPWHLAPELPYVLGGEEPLDGVSAYDGGDYYHLVSYGFSELYAKESENRAQSGLGFELTLKLKKQDPATDQAELENMAAVFQSLAQLCFEQEEGIEAYNYLYTGQEEGLDAYGRSALCGFVTVPDELGSLGTPNGRVDLVQLVGVTQKELEQLLQERCTVQQLVERLGSSVTDFGRKD